MTDSSSTSWRALAIMFLLGAICAGVFYATTGCSGPTQASEPAAAPRMATSAPCCVPCDGGTAPQDAAVVVVPPDAPPPAPVVKARPRIYLPAHRDRLAKLLADKHPAAVRWKGVADRWLAGSTIWGWQAWHGALASQLGLGEKYCTKAVATIDAAVKAEETLIAGGKSPSVAGDSYLEVGDKVGDMMLVLDWCHAQTSATQRTRWVALAEQAVWNVWNHKAATWGGRSAPWTGWSVDNPSNNYHYSFMRATMLLALAGADVPGARSELWLQTFKSKLAAAHAVFRRDLAGGGSREGTGYGVAMRRLFEIYSWWQASTGERIADESPHARASIAAMMHQVVPSLDRIAPVGDQSRDSTAKLFDYHRHYLLELAALYPTDPMAARALGLLQLSGVPAMTSSFMVVYDFLLAGGAAAPSLEGTPLAYRAAGIGGLYARTSWAKDGAWFGMQAGPYTESHAHQDQGSIMLFTGGTWSIGDGVLYSKSGLPQGPEVHSMVRIEGVRQSVNTSAAVQVWKAGNGWRYAAVDATPVYKGVVALAQRDAVFFNGALVVFDRVRTATQKQVLQYVLPSVPTISGTKAKVGTTELWGGAGAWTSTELRSTSTDLTGGVRLEVRRPAGDQRYVTVIGWGGAVTQVAVGERGASFQLRGQPVVVTFERDRPGASVSLAGQISLVGAGQVEP